MRKKLLVNNSEKCLCGSGKTFKDCCKSKINDYINITEDIFKNPHRINHKLQQQMKLTDFKICFHPDKANCRGYIKGAHALQNNGVLSLIAEDGHVMVTDPLNKIREGFILHKLSKNDATTFYGFCHYHDTEIFKEIETVPYTNQLKQNFLYAYRAFMYLFHKRVRLLKACEDVFKEFPALATMQKFIDKYRDEEFFLTDDLSYKADFDDAFINSNFDILESYVYEFKDRYDFAVTTSFTPAYDLKGKQIDGDYTDNTRLSSVFVTAFPTKTNFYFILSCLKRDYKNLQSYFNQIKDLNEEELKIFLNNVLPTYTSNIILSPRLWNRWTIFSKKEYEKMIAADYGQLDKVLSGKPPFESNEEYLKALDIKNGINDMMAEQKYDLFKI